MICSPVNMSTPGACFKYVSKILNIMDTYFRRVHAGNMKEKQNKISIRAKQTCIFTFPRRQGVC